LDIQRYCVAGTPAACGKTYTVVSDDSCSLVESKNGISDATLHALNPWIDANCDIQVGQSICVGAPAAAPTNIAPGSWTK
jgi:LysM repeat protein